MQTNRSMEFHITLNSKFSNFQMFYGYLTILESSLFTKQSNVYFFVCLCERILSKTALTILMLFTGSSEAEKTIKIGPTTGEKYRFPKTSPGKSQYPLKAP